jgi:hypothetical protein
MSGSRHSSTSWVRLLATGHRSRKHKRPPLDAGGVERHNARCPLSQRPPSRADGHRERREGHQRVQDLAQAHVCSPSDLQPVSVSSLASTGRRLRREAWQATHRCKAGTATSPSASSIASDHLLLLTQSSRQRRRRRIGRGSRAPDGGHRGQWSDNRRSGYRGRKT